MLSLLGSGMTWFGLTLWAWNASGEATPLALVSLFSYAPALLLSPIAGVFVDRWQRKLVLALSDSGCVVGTMVVWILYSSGHLELWHVYVVALAGSGFTAFEYPAYKAAVTMMLPPEQYARAEGMMGLAESAATILAPLAAAALFGVIGLRGIMLIDIVTYLIALSTLLVVYIPQPSPTPTASPGWRGIVEDMWLGFRYLWQQPALRMLNVIFCLGNLCEGLGVALITPMILARTGNNEVILGSVQSAGALGGVIGAAVLSAWGGPQRRAQGMVLSWAAAFGLGLMLIGAGGQTWWWAVGNFCFYALAALVNGLDTAFWQVKVAPEIQGRVFASRLFIIQLPYVLMIGLAGPLADWVCEPAMIRAGFDPGSGMALLIMTASLSGMVITLVSYARHWARQADELIPDQTQPSASD